MLLLRGSGMNGQVEATFYLQIKHRSPHRAVATQVTQGPPHSVDAGTVVIKLTVRLPELAFAPPLPEAIITVPEEMIHAVPAEVEVLDANPPEVTP